MSGGVGGGGPGRWTIWGPVGVLIVAGLGAWRWGEEVGAELPLLLLVLQGTFLGGGGCFVAFAAARTVSRRASAAVLMLGTGSLVMGLTGLLAAVVVPMGYINAGLTVHNTGALLAGLCHLLAGCLMGVTRPRGGEPGAGAGGVWLAGAYALVLTAVTVLSAGALLGLTPAFMVPGEGPTGLRQGVLLAAAALFAASAVVIGVRAYGRSESGGAGGSGGFGKWYATGAALMAGGLLTVMPIENVGSCLGWVGRIAQYTGAAYMVAAVVSAARHAGAWEEGLRAALRDAERDKAASAAEAAARTAEAAARTAEAAESLARLETLAEATPSIAFVFDADGRNGYANRRWAEYFGESFGTLSERMWVGSIHPDDYAWVVGKWADCARRGEAFEAECRLPRKDGAVRWHLCRVVPVRGTDGVITAWCGTNTDIHDLKVAEASARESRERLELAVSAARLFAFEWDVASDIVRRDGEMACEILGVSWSQEPATAFFSRVHPDDRAAFRETVMSLRPGSGTYRTTYRVLRTQDAGGGTAEIEESGRGEFDAEGRLVRLIGMSADVTDRRRAEQAKRQAEEERRRAEDRLRENDRLVAEMTSLLPGVMYLYDLEHRRTVWVNREVSAALGYTEQEVLAAGGEFMPRVIHPDDLSAWAAYQETATEIPDGETRTWAYRLRHKDGSWRWFQSRDVAFRRGADGRVSQLLGVATDVTEHKRYEERLRRNSETFRSLIESNPFGVYVVDADFRVAIVGLGAIRAFSGVRPLIGRDIGEVIRQIWPEPFASETTGRFRHTLETGEPFESPSMVERREDRGVVEAYDWRIERITMPDGRHGVVCYFYDLSERTAYVSALKASEQSLLESERFLRESERSLRESEHRLAVGVTVAGLGLAEVDYATASVRLSAKAAQLFGFGDGSQPLTVSRDAVHATFHPEDRAELGRRIEMSIDPAGAGYFEMDHRVVWPDGSVRWLRVRKQVTFEERAGDGQDATVAGDVPPRGVVPVRSTVAALDVTAEREAAASVQRSEAFLRAVLDSLPEHVVVLDDRGIVRAVNEPWLRFARDNGGTEVVAEGADYLAVCRRASADGDPYAAKVLGELEAVLSGEMTDCEVQYPCPTGTGEVRWYRMHARRPASGVAAGQGDDDRMRWVGLPGGVIMSHMDVTPSVLAEVAVRESEARFRSLVEAFPGHLWTADADGRVDFAGPQLAAYTGVPAEQMHGERWFGVIHPDDQEPTRRTWAASLATGEPYDVEFRIRGADGEYRWFATRAIGYREADGRVHKWYGFSSEIDARRRIEAQLAATRERLETAISAGDVATWVWEIPDDRIYADRNLRLFYGVSESDADGGPVGAFMKNVDPDYLDQLEGQISGSLERGDTFQSEYPVIGTDGKRRWVLARGQIERDASGRAARMVGVVMDITPRHEAENALRESEQRFRVMADGLPAVVWVHDATGAQKFVNRTFAEYFGVEADSMTGDHWLSLVHPDDGTGYIAAFAAAMRDRTEFRSALRVRRADGSWRWLESYGRPRFSGDGEFLGMVGGSFDVTERRNAEVALRASEERLRLARDAAGIGIHDFDPVAGVITWDTRVRELWGLGSDDPVDYDVWLAGIHPEDRAGADAAVKRALDPAGDGVFRADYRVIGRRDGVERWVAVTGNVTFAGATAVRMVGTAQDVTARVRAERELRSAMVELETANTELARANRAKDEFLAALSHELRTPLTPVLLLADQLVTRGDLAGTVRDDLTAIRDNVELEVRLIDDLLDLTRVTRGKVELHQRDVDLHRVVYHALETCLDAAFRDKGLRLVESLSARQYTVRGDPARLGQIVWNLLKNAVKFTPNGGQLTVMTSNPTPGTVRLEVCDTGIGIAPDVLPRVFDAFQQGGRDVTRQFGGLGLGLAIARAMVELHGGRISAHSDGTGKGATFAVELPLLGLPARDTPTTETPTGETSLLTPPAPPLPAPAPAAPVAASVSAPAVAPAAVTSGGAGGRVLLVEDHEPTRRVMARLLASMGHRVLTAGSVTEALSVAGDATSDGLCHIELVVSDVGLPDGTGQELMRVLRQRHGLRGIALSGYGTDADVSRSHEAGFSEHLVKPVTVDRLRVAIDRVLSSPTPDAGRRNF